jgi:hypothetical protein
MKEILLGGCFGALIALIVVVTYGLRIGVYAL